MKLAIASVLTLGLLFSLLLAIVAGVMYAIGTFDFWLLLLVTAVIFFFQWLLSPRLSDLVFWRLYGLRWIGIKELRERDEEVASFLTGLCRKHGIKVPRIGYIEDDNPQAFCYGSAAFNARLVLTEGIFTYLETEERKAVLAHEIGHIVHRDFIVMSLAGFIVALLYHISQALSRARGGKRGKAAFIGAIAHVFYLLGTCVLLLLSRIREYFADEFAAKEIGNSNPLAIALLKVAYGIIARPEEKRQLELMQGTRTLGIMDFKAARGIGIAYLTCLQLKSWEPIQRIFLFDLYNPWAFVYELGSSHPLVAKRIRRLDGLYDVKAFDYQAVKTHPVIRTRLYPSFLRDIFFNFLPRIFLVSFVLSLALVFVGIRIPLSAWEMGGIFLTGLGASIVLKTMYRYPATEPSDTNVLELMRDAYASPIRGKRVRLHGKVVGRGIPGLILSEDMMFQDKTGLIYLNYEGLIPLLNNLVFALFKLNEFVGKTVRVDGWFLRGLTTRLELREVRTDGKRARSFVRLWGLLVGIALAFLGAVIFGTGMIF
jgi:Zn-dependent protease with chaperone function